MGLDAGEDGRRTGKRPSRKRRRLWCTSPLFQLKRYSVQTFAFPPLTPPQKSCNFPYLEFGESQASFEDKARFSVRFGRE